MVDDALKEFAEKQLPRLKSELAGWQRERAVLDTRIEDRRRTIEALEKELASRTDRLFEAPMPVSSNGAGPTHSAKPPTGEAISRVIDESDDSLSTAEVYSELERRGWLPEGKDPRASVGSGLWYLASQEKISATGYNRSRRWLRKDLAPPEGGAKTNVPERVHEGG